MVGKEYELVLVAEREGWLRRRRRRAVWLGTLVSITRRENMAQKTIDTTLELVTTPKQLTSWVNGGWR